MCISTGVKQEADQHPAQHSLQIGQSLAGDVVNQRGTFPLSSSVTGYPRDTRIPQALTAAPPGLRKLRQPRCEALPTVPVAPASSPPWPPERSLPPSPSPSTLAPPPTLPPIATKRANSNSKPLFLSFSRIKSRLSFIPFLIPFIFLLLVLLYLDWQAPQSFWEEES